MLWVIAQGFLYQLPSDLVASDDALGVDPQQDGDAVAGPLCNLGGVAAAVEPCRQAGVPEVVRPAGERGGTGRRITARRHISLPVTKLGTPAERAAAPAEPALSARRDGPLAVTLLALGLLVPGAQSEPAAR